MKPGTRDVFQSKCNEEYRKQRSDHYVAWRDILEGHSFFRFHELRAMMREIVYELGHNPREIYP